MKLLCLVTVLALLGTGLALKCYTCNSAKPISGLGVAGALLNVLKDSPPCTEFDPSNPDKKFIRDCPTLNDKSCLKATDPNDPKNQIRTCFMMDKNECSNKTCYCKGDLCNGSSRGWPSAVLMLAALAAALVGGR